MGEGEQLDQVDEEFKAGVDALPPPPPPPPPPTPGIEGPPPGAVPETLEEGIARVCHEANRALCRALGDDSQVAWEDAPEWQRQSVINGVRFNLENPGASPAATHESWLAEKRAAGWRYGPTKDVARKVHPCFRPYEELPPEQRAKDQVFQAIVRALAR